jgi:hypothetical protein
MAACGGINVAQPHDAGPDVESADVAEERTEVDVVIGDVTVADTATADVTAADTRTADVAAADVMAADVTAADVANLDVLAPFTPANIQSQLAFWFDPGSLVSLSGPVTKWSDRSNNANDAVQSVTAYEPAYTQSGIAGLPSATFTGPITFLAIADVASMQWATSDFFILAVVRANADTTSAEAMVYQKTGPFPYDGASLYLNADKPNGFTTLVAAQVSGGAGAYVVSLSPPTTYVDSSVHVLGARRSANTLEIRVDGRVSNSLTNAAIGTTNVSSVGWAAIIGQNGYGTPSAEFQQVHGDVAEMIGVRGALDLQTVANLEQYLKSRYGVP